METTSIVQAGEVVGSLFAGPIGDWGGRRLGMQTACLLVTMGVIIQISVAGSIPALTVGRAVLGMGIGCISNSVPLYLSEIPPAAIRGSIVGSWQLMLAIGQVIGACVGQGVKDRTDTGAYRIPMGINLGIVLLLSSGALWIPESPRWLFSKGKEQESIRALERVNAGQPDVKEAVQEQFLAYAKAREDEIRLGGNEPSRWSDLFRGTTRRKFVCAVGILISQQIGGVQFIFSYTTTFLSGVGIENAFLITIIVDLVEVIGVVVSFFLVNRYGRRPLLLITSAFMTIVGAMGSLHGNRTSSQNNLIAAGIILYVFFFNLAWGPLAWVIATELSVGKNRQKIMSVGTACFWTSAFIVTFTMPYLYDATKANLEAQIGYIYAGGSIIAMIFVYFWIPETLGRSLEEINHMMDAEIPTLEWSSYDLSRDVGQETVTKGGARVEHIDRVDGVQPDKVEVYSIRMTPTTNSDSGVELLRSRFRLRVGSLIVPRPSIESSDDSGKVMNESARGMPVGDTLAQGVSKSKEEVNRSKRAVQNSKRAEQEVPNSPPTSRPSSHQRYYRRRDVSLSSNSIHANDPSHTTTISGGTMSAVGRDQNNIHEDHRTTTHQILQRNYGVNITVNTSPPSSSDAGTGSGVTVDANKSMSILLAAGVGFAAGALTYSSRSNCKNEQMEEHSATANPTANTNTNTKKARESLPERKNGYEPPPNQRPLRFPPWKHCSTCMALLGQERAEHILQLMLEYPEMPICVVAIEKHMRLSTLRTPKNWMRQRRDELGGPPEREIRFPPWRHCLTCMAVLEREGPQLTWRVMKEYPEMPVCVAIERHSRAEESDA
ncbi:hypothetical protein D9757_005203 [Collybiopsis confluens]|uniref:Major facilitator superfamily (MFS) profile domain-containing protein n=1 Tax=Collybiopsis confluens TaxID=2823264 RepID=A0A8H5HW10_9AGAR|nr:hypothetical protein D9757_005203 [Collybiopsis confluens]